MLCASCGERSASRPCSACGADPLLDGRYHLERALASQGETLRYQGWLDDPAQPLLICERPLRRRDWATAFADRVALLREEQPGLEPLRDIFESGSGRHRLLYTVRRWAELEQLDATSRPLDNLALVQLLAALTRQMDRLHARGVLLRRLAPEQILLAAPLTEPAEQDRSGPQPAATGGAESQPDSSQPDSRQPASSQPDSSQPDSSLGPPLLLDIGGLEDVARAEGFAQLEGVPQAPELRSGAIPDPSSDLYLLGALGLRLGAHPESPPLHPAVRGLCSRLTGPRVERPTLPELLQRLDALLEFPDQLAIGIDPQKPWSRGTRPIQPTRARPLPRPPEPKGSLAFSLMLMTGLLLGIGSIYAVVHFVLRSEPRMDEARDSFRADPHRVPDGLGPLRFGLREGQVLAQLADPEDTESLGPARVRAVGQAPQEGIELPGSRLLVNLEMYGRVARCELSFAVSLGLSRIRCGIPRSPSRAAHFLLEEEMLATLIEQHGPVHELDHALAGSNRRSWIWRNDRSELRMDSAWQERAAVGDGATQLPAIVLESATAEHRRMVDSLRRAAEAMFARQEGSSEPSPSQETP